MTFYRTHFNFEDVTRDYFPIFPLRALKPEPRRAGQSFFAVVFTCDIRDQIVLRVSGIIKHFAIWGQIKQL